MNDNEPNPYLMSWEEERLKEIKDLVDPICEMIRLGVIDEEEARRLADKARLEASFKIPDQMDLYDLIYESRIERLIEQFLRPSQ
jgi:hypothetical protein